MNNVNQESKKKTLYLINHLITNSNSWSQNIKLLKEHILNNYSYEDMENLFYQIDSLNSLRSNLFITQIWNMRFDVKYLCNIKSQEESNKYSNIKTYINKQIDVVSDYIKNELMIDKKNIKPIIDNIEFLTTDQTIINNVKKIFNYDNLLSYYTSFDKKKQNKTLYEINMLKMQFLFAEIVNKYLNGKAKSFDQQQYNQNINLLFPESLSADNQKFNKIMKFLKDNPEMIGMTFENLKSLLETHNDDEFNKLLNKTKFDLKKLELQSQNQKSNNASNKNNIDLDSLVKLLPYYDAFLDCQNNIKYNHHYRTQDKEHCNQFVNKTKELLRKYIFNECYDPNNVPKDNLHNLKKSYTKLVADHSNIPISFMQKIMLFFHKLFYHLSEPLNKASVDKLTIPHLLSKDDEDADNNNLQK